MQIPEPFQQVAYGHLYKVGYASPINLYPVGLLLKTSATTIRTRGASTIATQHHTILYLILVVFDHLEERVDANLVMNVHVLLGWQPMPQHILLGLGQGIVGGEDGEVVFLCASAELFLPSLHLLSMPAFDASLIDTQRRIGDNQFLVNADDASKALAGRAGPYRRVEGEHIVIGLFEGYAVGLESCGELVGQVGWYEYQYAGAVAFVHGGLCRIDQA